MNKIINIKNTLVAIIAVSLISCNTSNDSTSKKTSENPFKTQVDSILNLMTLDEKIGQLNLPATGPITTGSSKSTDVVKKIEDGKKNGHAISRRVRRSPQTSRKPQRALSLEWKLRIIISKYSTTYTSYNDI